MRAERAPHLLAAAGHREDLDLLARLETAAEPSRNTGWSSTITTLIGSRAMPDPGASIVLALVPHQ
jgi:hypothetical protein